MKKALELLMGGEKLSAAEAVAVGLVNRAVPHDELMPVAWTFAQRLAGFGAGTVKMLRQLMFAASSPNYEHALFTAREVSTLMRFSSDFKGGGGGVPRSGSHGPEGVKRFHKPRLRAAPCPRWVSRFWTMALSFRNEFALEDLNRVGIVPGPALHPLRSRV